MPVQDPTKVIAAHIGNGVVQVRASHPDYSSVDHFEVQGSLSLSGPYNRTNTSTFSGEDGFLYGFVPGMTVYMQVRAVGVDKSIGNWVQVIAATVSKPSVLMLCRGIVGSQIVAGSLFTMPKAHRIFGFVSQADILFVAGDNLSWDTLTQDQESTLSSDDYSVLPAYQQ